MNLPNKLTIVRIILTPVFLFFFLSEFIPHHFLFAMLVFILASVTDFADGYIARSRKIVTNFGKIADPIADKILTTSVLLCFLKLDLCSVWIIMIILAREFTISAIRITAASQGSVIPANIFGKIKTSSQMLFSVAILAMIMFIDEGIISMEYDTLSFISGILLWITAALAVVSGAVYIKDSAKVIDFTK
ncbi:MAG: CDP-diacylglycerol--glycerol-3-phosphate 3-phosphatidyltransferase [Clostridiales bacterium]|nr:CDP-diacylglycerol--glycerol-3-phosphate 3-phosphatidyltransferase [Clostridiales bacterium]MCD7827972.1 CDP-diacylglycerol--glycerol-3-phosphate 3-phosphatidyltransferase [Clostridiales bacterium]